MPTIEIKRAQLADVALISRIGAEWFEETFRGTCTDEDMSGFLAQNYNLSQMECELANPHDFFYVLFREEKAVGYSRLKASQPPEGMQLRGPAIELKRFYFAREAHGQGLAHQLLNFNLDLARLLQMTHVFVSVWEGNERANAFYRKHGFRETGIANPFPIGQTPQTDYWYLLDL